jgi:general secretion pathway protein J
MKRQSISHPKGFTLLELLLALALTATLMTMLTAGVYGVIRDWDDNASGLEHTLDETIAMLQLERALLGAFPHSYRDPATLGRHVYFDGEKNELSWVSSVSPQRQSGLTAWRLYSVGNQGIYLQLAPALSDHPGQRLRAADPILLLEGYRVEFSYLYQSSNLDRRWRDSWQAHELLALPLGVHLRLIPTGGNNAANTREIVAPIMANLHRSLQANTELLR